MPKQQSMFKFVTQHISDRTLVYWLGALATQETKPDATGSQDWRAAR